MNSEFIDAQKNLATVLSAISTQELTRLIDQSISDESFDTVYADVLMQEYISRIDTSLDDVDSAYNRFQRAADDVERIKSVSSKYEGLFTVPVKDITNDIPRHVRTRRMSRLLRVTLVSLLTIVIIMVSGVVAIAVHPIRDVIAKWTDEIFMFTRVSEAIETPSLTNDNHSNSYSSLQDALNANGITAKLSPTKLPNGFQYDSVTSEVLESWATVFVASYVNELGEYIIITIMYYENDDFYSMFEKTDDDVTVIERFGVQHYVYNNDITRSVAWTSGRIECVINFPESISDDVILDVIMSIYEE